MTGQKLGRKKKDGPTPFRRKNDGARTLSEKNTHTSLKIYMRYIYIYISVLLFATIEKRRGGDFSQRRNDGQYLGLINSYVMGIWDWEIRNETSGFFFCPSFE